MERVVMNRDAKDTKRQISVYIPRELEAAIQREKRLRPEMSKNALILEALRKEFAKEKGA